MGERLRDKTVPCQVQLSLIQTVTNSFPCGAHLHPMGLRGSNDYTLCQRVRNQREDDQHEGCGRIDPETLVHIQSVRCDLQTRTFTSVYHHCSQKVQGEISTSSVGDSNSVTRVNGVDLPDTRGGQSIQTFWKKTCRELYRRTTLLI